MMVFISNGKKLHVSAYSGHPTPKPSTRTATTTHTPTHKWVTFTYIGKETNFIARKLSKPEDGRYRSKHVVFPLLINTIS